MTTTIFNREEHKPGVTRGMGGFPLRLVALLLIAFVSVLLILNVVRVTRVGAGYVGVEINLAGSQRGAQEIPIRTGWVFYSPLKSKSSNFRLLCKP